MALFWHMVLSKRRLFFDFSHVLSYLALHVSFFALELNFPAILDEYLALRIAQNH